MRTTTDRRWLAGAFAIAFAIMLGALLEGTVFTHTSALGAEPGPVAATAAAPTTVTPATPRDLGTVFADLADRTIPAVVEIQARFDAGSAATEQETPRMPEEFRWFFGDPEMPGRPQPRLAGGSGFLVSPDGYIVTNRHVAGDADALRVTLSDQRTLDATLVGSDPTTDVAVIKIDAQDLPYLEWGSSSALRVGSWVLAVGNPGYGDGQLESTVTNGIVSAKGRPLRLIEEGLRSDPRYGEDMAGYAIENFIQTDAVINPGNSGGPMIDLDGRVVGMNTAIASTDGHYQGYGFAIPSDLVRKVATDLMEHGSVRRPWLGVQVTAVAPEDAEAFDLPSVSGVLVQGVTEDSPAEAAGLEQGDVIVSVDGQSIASGGGLQQQIAVRDPDDRVTIGYYRDGREHTAEVRLGRSPGVEAIDHSTSARPASESTTQRTLGITVATLDDRWAEQLGFDQAGGVVITEVEPMGPAASRGIAAGLRVDRIDQTRVREPKDVTDALTKAETGTVVSLHLSDASGGSRIVNVRVR